MRELSTLAMLLHFTVFSLFFLFYRTSTIKWLYCAISSPPRQKMTKRKTQTLNSENITFPIAPCVPCLSGASPVYDSITSAYLIALETGECFVSRPIQFSLLFLFSQRNVRRQTFQRRISKSLIMEVNVEKRKFEEGEEKKMREDLVCRVLLLIMNDREVGYRQNCSRK